MDIIREASASQPTNFTNMGETIADTFKNTIVEAAKEQLKNAAEVCTEKTCTYAILSNAIRVAISNKILNMPAVTCGIHKYLGVDSVTFVSQYAFDFGQLRCIIEFQRTFAK
jgi:hypothetical protein